MKLDDFEAVFRSAVKDRFELAPPALERVALVTDLPSEQAQVLLEQARGLLAGHKGELDWRCIGAADYASVPELLGLIEAMAPDLIVSYRHLHLSGKGLAHSLGAYIDTLTQAARPPVLLLPPPTAPDLETRLQQPERVLVVTDHLCGEDVLVNWGVLLCKAKGHLYLAHIEDDKTFRRYSEFIAMIPDVDTDTVLSRLEDKLLGRPSDYIQTIADALKKQGIQEHVIPIVGMGHALSDYKRIIDDNDIQLIVLATKDEDQLAMHGMAYAVSVEIQDRPLLLL